STSRINSAVAYPKANRDFSAMATGSHGDHAPVSVELGRKCGRSGTDDCESGRQSEGAHTIANHGSPHTCVVLLVKNANRRTTLIRPLAHSQAWPIAYNEAKRERGTLAAVVNALAKVELI